MLRLCTKNWKRPGSSQKKNDRTVLFQCCHGQFLGSIKQPGQAIWKKSIKRPVLSFFSNYRSLERPGLMREFCWQKNISKEGFAFKGISEIFF